MKRTSVLILGILGLLIVSSCVSRKEIAYLQDLPELEQAIEASKDAVRIQPNDMLQITVSAANIEAVMPFNLPVTSAPRLGQTAGTISGNMQLQSYLVDSDGNIEFPVLGTTSVAGKTRQELIRHLKQEISAYVQDPIVNINLTNFQITVIGEVNQPGTFNVPDERISLSKAIGLAGDLTIYGRRDNVMVLRETGETMTYGFVDLRNSDFLESPFYNLQQNDVVVVEPNKAQMQGAAYNRNASVYVSLASVIIAVISVLIR